jgi:hypothetical protein
MNLPLEIILLIWSATQEAAATLPMGRALVRDALSAQNR